MILDEDKLLSKLYISTTLKILSYKVFYLRLFNILKPPFKLSCLKSNTYKFQMTSSIHKFHIKPVEHDET
jgi:hypothetical protein